MVSLGIFYVVPPTEPCALRSTQLLKVSTRDLSWGKGGRCVWLTTYHPCSAEMSRESGALIYPEPLGPPWPVTGDLYFTCGEWRHILTHSKYAEIPGDLNVVRFLENTWTPDTQYIKLHNIHSLQTLITCEIKTLSCNHPPQTNTAGS